MNLKKLSLTISLLGVITLLILTNTLEPKLTSINKITIKELNKKVKIQGKIINIKNYENSRIDELFYILTVSDTTEEIEVILNIKKTLNLKINQNVTITGRVNTYKNQLQIQAEKIILKN